MWYSDHRHQLKVGVFKPDGDGDFLIGSTELDLSPMMVAGAGQRDGGFELYNQGKSVGEIRLVLTYDGVPRPEFESPTQERASNQPRTPEILEADLNTTWDLDSVLPWLRRYGFSSTWQSAFERLDLHGLAFLEIGNYPRKGAIDTIRLKLLLEIENSSLADLETRNLDIDRLRLLVRRIGRKTYGTNAGPVPPTECLVLEDFTATSDYTVKLIKGELVTVVEKGDQGKNI